MKKLIYTLTLMVMSIGVTAQTVVDIVVNSDDHNTLEAAVIAADLAGTLSGPGPFTVFAPTDAAFDALPAGTLDALLADPSGDLTDILLYHVVSGSILSTDLNDGDTAPTLLGPNINVGVNMMMVNINGVDVSVANLTASNGVVHVIDAVLTPPTVVDIVVDSPVHETLEAAVIAAELAGTLSGDGPFTVFAPTDDAFAALPAGLVDALLADPTGDLANILLYHVVGGTALSTDLNDGDAIATLLGPDVNVSIDMGTVMINGAEVVIADILASNGVVHVIDAVLTPPTVVDIVVNSPVHETLEAAVIAAELAGTLSGDGPFTVFAPTDDAFAALPAGVLDALLADPTGALADILLYHVVGGTALSTDLNDGDAIATLLGPDVNVSIDMGTVMINGAEVVIADILASNGVVHVIDAVLTPPTVYDIIANSDIHNTLETAIDLAELDATLSGEGTFTVFAPTDAAFAALETAVLNEILADPAGTLTDYLLYHVVGSIAFAADLNDGDALPTLFTPNEVVISIDGGVVSINGVATVTIADIQASNGVVHVIDAVLTPPTNVEDAAFAANLNIYPNPAADQMTIAGDLPVNARMFITDASGRIIMSDNFFGSRTIDVSSLESGMYFLSFRTENAVAVRTFIVE
ncbi:MAG: fasciclin domain-containing protein [Flavobacteriales bacterium]|nr:fasciclin domain-containing protein [Flavobacteriales bacterium]